MNSRVGSVNTPNVGADLRLKKLTTTIFDSLSVDIWGKVQLSDMLSPSTIAHIKAEIARLEDARKQCNDSSIRQLIEQWLADLKKRSPRPNNRAAFLKGTALRGGISAAGRARIAAARGHGG